MTHRKFPVLCLLILLAGCASVSESPQHPPRQEPPAAALPVEPELPQERREQPSIAPDRVKPPAVGARTASPAIVALLKEAEASRSSGRLDKAAATLERAIRIQPRNPMLWNQMAEVRLQQNQPGFAEDLAKKSIVLAKGNRSLIQKNWSIIARARRAKGDSAGAAEAEVKAGR